MSISCPRDESLLSRDENTIVATDRHCIDRSPHDLCKRCTTTSMFWQRAVDESIWMRIGQPRRTAPLLNDVLK